MKTATFTFVFWALVSLTTWAQSPFPYYSPGQNNPMVGINAAGAADFYFGPRVIVVDRGWYPGYYTPRYVSPYRYYRRW